MAAAVGPGMQMLGYEQQGAAQVVRHNQTQDNVTIDQDALASAALIYAAIKNFDEKHVNAVIAEERKRLKNCIKKLAQRLTFNTLVPWYQGAAFTVGTRDQLDFAMEAADPAGAAKPFNPKDWFDSDGEPKEWLRAVRRQNGNGWDGALAAATFIETKKKSKMREAYWDTLPPSTGADKIAGVRGYAQ